MEDPFLTPRSLQKTMNLGMDTKWMLSHGSYTPLTGNYYHLRVTAQCDTSRGSNALANEIPACWVPSPQHVIKVRWYMCWFGLG